MQPVFNFAVVGIDHRHIYSMTEHLIEAGAACIGWWTEGDPESLAGFVKRFPDLRRIDSREALLTDPSVSVILCAAPPDERAAIAIEAMRNGKDVMVDKAGCTTLEQLGEIRTVAKETGRIWSAVFSERFLIPAVEAAKELVDKGEIGRVIQTIGLGPHRLNAKTRPDWFFQKQRYGGILGDIASHQIDQFLYFTGARTAEIVMASADNVAHPEYPELEDFGEIVLKAGQARAYIRVDWFTPDGLPTWGDGRLMILGTEGYIEIRKYVDIAGRPGTNHLFLVNGTRCEHVDYSGRPLRYFTDFVRDVLERTETAMPQEQCFVAHELCLKAQLMADAAPRAAG